MAAPSSKEGVKSTHSLRDFKGVNTQSSRQNIGDDEFSWLENVVPVGFGNMQTILGPQTIATNAWEAGFGISQAYFFQSVFLNEQNYIFIFTLDGSGWTYNLTTSTAHRLAPPSTFNNFGTAIASWSDTDIIIVNNKGYFTYDGTTLTLLNGQIASITINAIGSGFTTAPTLTISGGGGSGATATADIQVGLATLVAAGTGYEVNDILTVQGGTIGPGGAAQLTVSAIGSGGTITGVNLTFSGDYTVAPTNPASVAGGYGTGATFTLNFGIGPITVTSPGLGYTSEPTVSVSGSFTNPAELTANLAVVPPYGNAVATFSGRVWVAAGRTISFSAPGSFTDFSTANGGGSFVMTDETLQSDIFALVSANNYLYVFGTSSINIISGVQVVSGITVFSNTNISASIGVGTPNSTGNSPGYSITPYYRAMSFSTPYGFYILSGTTPQKISDHLDGIFPLINGVIPISGGTVVLNGVICLAFMFKYNDPVLGPRTLIAVLFNKKWFFTSQGNNLTLMTTAIIDGTPILYATDGYSIFQLFNESSTTSQQTIQTKLWDMGDPVRDKHTLRVGVESVTPVVTNTILGTVDTEYSEISASFVVAGGLQVNWINNLQQKVIFVNSSNQPTYWWPTGYDFKKQDVQTVGKYIGVTLISDAPGEIYNAIHLQYEPRASWTTLPT